MSKPLSIAIDCQIAPGKSGGVATFVRCLVHALGQLPDGDERYTLIVRDGNQLEWLEPFVGRNQRLVVRAKPSAGEAGPTFASRLKRTLGPLLPAAKRVQQVINIERQWPEVPLSDGFYESLGCDVLHITTQNFVVASMPTVYNPHDLQHLHYPQFWPPEVIAWRETIYPTGCRLAKTVVVGSQWIKDDVVRQYRVDPDKVQVIPEGPPVDFYAEPQADFLASVARKHELEQPFLLYPAVTWPHKNHVRLIEALAHLRDRYGMSVRLVCTGARWDAFWPSVQARLDELELKDQVRFLGFLPEDELRAIMRLSRALVMPSLYEACSLPVFEAWLEGVPVACSNAVALPDQVMDAGVMFDPNSVESIAEAVRSLLLDDALCEKLKALGERRATDFSWQRTAEGYRAAYRRAAGRPLGARDLDLLARDWMRHPDRLQPA